MSLIYKILPAAEWDAAVAAGVFAGAGIDLTDGYIHFSTAAQARETARRHFAGRQGLVVVQFDTDDLAGDGGDGVRWEPSRGGDLFAHLYGTLDPAAALSVRPAPLGPDGVPDLGDLS